jgi:predicted RNA-binding Zn-ribbon protein involved in translation (DUF1610 family)
MRKKNLIFPLIGTFIFSCSASFNSSDEALNTPLEVLVKNCDNYVGKKVKLKATYLGWNCPKNCSNPGITRADTCIQQKQYCIYLLGFGGLNPLKDKNSKHTFYGIVKKNQKGVCYIEVLKVE